MSETVGLPARRIACRALSRFEDDDPERARIGTALAITAGEARASSRDRQLAQELAFGVVRRLRTIDRLLLELLPKGLPDHGPTRSALRLGVFQLAWTTVPAHAAVHTSVSLVPRGGRSRLINAVLRRVSERLIDSDSLPSQSMRAVALPDGRFLSFESDENLAAPDTPAWTAFEHGLPAWLVEGWSAEYGREAAAAAALASSTVPHVFVRTDPGERESLRTELVAAGVEVVASPDHPDVLRIAKGARIAFEDDLFRNGRFVIQDPTAVRAVDAVAAVPGCRVLDLCAAPGTKTTRLARAVGPDGCVVAVDSDETRRQRITDNAARLGLGNVTVLGSLEEIETAERFDSVLVDVPCSNTGVLARRPEVRHRLLSSDVQRIATTQRGLLTKALDRCRVGGRVVYSTCSLEPAENREVVEAVCLNRSDVDVVRLHTTLPQAGRRDGGFYAVMQRRCGEAELSSTPST